MDSNFDSMLNPVAGELAVLGVLLTRGAFQRLPCLDLAMELAPPLVNGPREQQESKMIGPIDLASILGDMLPSVANRGRSSLSFTFVFRVILSPCYHYLHY